jgi:uncharacterized membrane protein (DUF4010 family)
MAIPLPYRDAATIVALALGVGVLIGLEREWAQKAVSVRTFAITALLGAVTAIAGEMTVFVAFIGLTFLLTLMNIHSLLKRDALELTTSVALLVTLALGALIGVGHYFTATAAAFLMTLLLSFKAGFSAFAGTLQLEEIRSAVLIALLSFVIYPLVPRHSIVAASLLATALGLLLLFIANRGFGGIEVRLAHAL